jgi:hypothetical protein
MVPAVFVPLAALPLTASGKLDRKALPAPDLTSTEAYVAPRTPTEETIARIWSTLLRVERVGADDDFFALGGHSLLATQVVSRVRAELGVEVPLRAVFETRSLAAFAAQVAQSSTAPTGAAPPLVAGPRGERPPLSFAQQRLWTLHQFEPDSPAYHLTDTRRIAQLDVDALRGAFEHLVTRHEILRTRFPAIDDVPYQDIQPAAPFVLDVEDARGLEPDATFARVASAQHRPFDLAAAPPWRTCVVRVTDHEHVLFVTFHHIVTDGWSHDVFWRELWASYDALATGAPLPSLPALPVQYADYAAWQRRWLTGDELARQLAFWTERLQGAPEEAALPLKGPRPARSAPGLDLVMQRLDADSSAQLRALVRSEGATLFMVLLAGFRTMLARVTDQGDLVIGTPLAGRTRRELEHLVGFFINTLALRTEVRPDESFCELLAREKAGALAAYEHQDTPYELIVDALRIARRPGLNPLFQIWFVHQNTPNQAPERGERLWFESPSASKFDLAVYSHDDGDAIAFTWQFSPALFDKRTVDQLATDYALLLAKIAAHPRLTIEELLS